jgi:hypothetical protein
MKKKTSEHLPVVTLLTAAHFAWLVSERPNHRGGSATATNKRKTMGYKRKR